MSDNHILAPKVDLIMAMDDLRLNGCNHSADLLKKALFTGTVSVEPVSWSAVEARISEFVNRYEMVGEDEQGRDGRYTPNESERALILDAMHGVLADDELMALLRPAAPVAAQAPVFSVGVRGVGIIDDNPSALAVYFNAAPNDDDIRALHEIVSAAQVATTSPALAQGEARMNKGITRGKDGNLAQKDGPEVAAQVQPEGVTLDGCLETLFRLGEYLGVDYAASRKAPGAPSGVYIKAIEEKGFKARDAALEEAAVAMEQTSRQGGALVIRALKSGSEAQQPVSSADGQSLAQKVRRDLYRRGCSEAVMRIAVESIVKHYEPPQSSGNSGQLEEWLNKTEFVQEWISTRKLSARYLGWHRTDVMRDLLEKQDADKVDAERYRLLRRGQHWSVINGIGDELRGDELDAAVEAVRKKKQSALSTQPVRSRRD